MTAALRLATDARAPVPLAGEPDVSWSRLGSWHIARWFWSNGVFCELRSTDFDQLVLDVAKLTAEGA